MPNWDWNNLSSSIKDSLGEAVLSPVEFTRGLLGLEPLDDPDRKKNIFQLKGAGKVNALAQILSAGLPFSAYKLPRVLHGTQKVFDTFDTSKNELNDTLGWMIHAAEEPHYANEYSSGSMKGVKPISLDSPKIIDPDELKVGYETYTPERGINIRPNTIPLHPNSKNVLDLANPNSDDLSQALAGIERNQRDKLIGNFKENRRWGRENPDSFYGSGKPGYSERQLASDLVGSFGKKERFNKSPFDAVRYFDAGEPSWAFPNNEELKTPWGIKVGKDTGNPLSVLRLQEGNPGSSLELTNNFRNPRNPQGNPLKSKPANNVMKEELDKVKNYVSPFGNDMPPKSSEDIKGWSNWLISHHPEYTDNKIHEMYYNNAVTAKEKNALILALHEKINQEVYNMPGKLSNKSIGLVKK